MSLDDVSPYLRVPQHRRDRPSVPVSSWRVSTAEQIRRGQAAIRNLRPVPHKPMRLLTRPVDSVQTVDNQTWGYHVPAPYEAVETEASPEALEEFEAELAGIRDPFRWKKIVLQVCHKHGISVTDIMSHRRGRGIVKARQEAMWRLKQETTMSLPEIGRKMGGFDHSTAIHSIQKHTERMAQEALAKAGG